MTSEKRYQTYEQLAYLVGWALLFLSPIALFFMRNSAQTALDWAEMRHVWRMFLPFLIVFIIHNFLLAPLLIYRRRRWTYSALVTVCVAVFTIVQCRHHPAFKQDAPMKPFDEAFPGPPPGAPEFEDAPFGPPPAPPSQSKEPHTFRPPMEQRDVVSVIVVVLMLGMNIGVKLFIRQLEDEKRLSKLEKENLEQQLEYLKYQINPHFLMNTLNNIHALVDINPEQAKETIVDLSKVMRFVLYEGNKQKVPLDRELTFLKNYIKLMRMRLTDKVSVEATLPDTVGADISVPPLLLITFVENAFKHGVSYQQPSFIRISVSVTGERLSFSCRNSKIPQAEDKHGGVGLKNAKRRLEIIYGQDFTLDIDDLTDSYNVTLDIPLT